MSSLQDRVAIVTGGAMGIGAATVRRLAAEGARVLVADIETEGAARIAADVEAAGGEALAVRVDVSCTDDIERMVESAMARWGRVDIVVNNAWNRKEPDGSALTLTESAFDYAVTAMVKALFWSAKHAIPHMQAAGGGSIVNISSVHGLLGEPQKLAYETAKHAVIGATRQMAVEFGPSGVRVNAICPGHILTERQRARWQPNPSMLRLMEAQYPLRRVGTPDDIANAIRFLCSDEAAFITGHTLVVDGGLTVQLQEEYGIHMARFLREHPETELPGEA